MDNTAQDTVRHAIEDIGTAAVSAMIPRAAGQTTDGVTLVRANYNWGMLNATEMHLRAPTTRSFAGMAFATAGDAASAWTVDLAGTVTLDWSGAVYMPLSLFRAQGSSRVVTLAGPDGTPRSGCSQLVAYTMLLGSRSYLGNQCADKSLQPFGTDTSTGWYVPLAAAGSGTGCGVAARPVP